MACQLQLIFSRADEKKNELKILKHQLKDEIEAIADYKNLCEQEEAIKLKKKQIILSVKQSNREMLEKMDSLALNVSSDKQMIADVALKDYIAGKDIRIKNKNGEILEPVFSVRYVKTGVFEGEKQKTNSTKISKKDLSDDDDDFFAR